jgi:hypothetical protein
LSVFKLLWNQLLYNFVQFNDRLPWMMRCDVGLKWLIGASLFNNLLVPYLAEAFTSPNCFLYALNAAPEIKVSYPEVICNTNVRCGLNFGCQDYVNCNSMNLNSLLDIPIVPIFEYSFQCSSSLLSAFVQVFLFRFLLCGLVEPVAMILLGMVAGKIRSAPDWRILSWRYMMRSQFSGCLEGVGIGGNQPHVILAEHLVVSMIQTLVLDISIVLTFGMLFPLLAVVGLLSIVKDVWYFRLLIGEWLCSVQGEERESVLQLLSDVSIRWKRHRHGFYQWLVVVVLLASLLLSGCVFDTYGDTVGAVKAMWVIFVLPGTTVLSLWLGSWVSVWNVVKGQQVESVVEMTDVESIENPIVKVSS